MQLENNPTKNRIYGLDTLRSLAIILVFMHHYTKLGDQSIFGFLGKMGWVGVDLFFVLSGYLIGNQIFSALVNQRKLSLKSFYYRRFLRTLPNYFLVLSLYFFIPDFREAPLLTPLWKFLTFTQNFNLSSSAFSHAWSLCIEEQFYLVFPLVVLLVAYRGSVRTGWLTIGAILIVEIGWRSFLWITELKQAGEHSAQLYISNIYYPTFGHLDGLVLGVAIAMLKNFHQTAWAHMTVRGNALLILGFLMCCGALYFVQNHAALFSTVFGYTLLALSFSVLVVAAISPCSWLYRIRIPGATLLATWSYAIYLTHKQFIHLAHNVLVYWNLSQFRFIALIVSVLLSLACGWLLYICVEAPFLRLRDKTGKVSYELQPTVK